jgi:hypothetical protein
MITQLVPELFCFAAAMGAVATRTDDAVAAVMARDVQRGQALLAGDAKALADIYSDTLLYTHSNGQVETKAEFVGLLADKLLTYQQFLTEGVNGSQITADVVVLRGRIDQRKIVRGQPGTAKLFFTSIWRLEAGTWRMAGMQTAIIPPPR